MGFATFSHDAAMAQQQSNSKALLWSLNNFEDSGTYAAFQYNGQQMEGHYHVVYFLTKFTQNPLYMYHEGASNREKFLCASMLDNKPFCNACEASKKYSQIYKGADYKKSPVKGQRTSVILPIYTPLYSQIKENKQILPVYWFELEVSAWDEETRGNYTRMKEADDLFGLDSGPVAIFKKKRIQGHKSEYFFQKYWGQPPTVNTAVHPLVAYYAAKSQVWDANYYQMLAYLPILRFQKYVDPETRVEQDYQGNFEPALQYYEALKQVWPQPVVKLETQQIPPMGVGGQATFTPQQYPQTTGLPF